VSYSPLSRAFRSQSRQRHRPDYDQHVPIRPMSSSRFGVERPYGSVPTLTVPLSLFLILSTATFLRLYGIAGPSFWVDEVYSAMAAESFSRMGLTDVHPPFYYALLSLWASFSTTDYSLRLLSAFFGVLTVAITYTAGRVLFNTPAALWAAAFLAIMPIHVEYSQEARPYALMTFLFATGIWAVFQIGGRRPLLPWLLYTMSSLLMCYCHGIGFMYWLALAIVLSVHLYFERSIKATWLAFGLANALVLLLFSPWLLLLKRQYEGEAYLKSPSSLLTPLEIPLYSFPFGYIPHYGRYLPSLSGWIHPRPPSTGYSFSPSSFSLRSQSGHIHGRGDVRFSSSSHLRHHSPCSSLSVSARSPFSYLERLSRRLFRSCSSWGWAWQRSRPEESCHSSVSC
jgi:4-amino-4-deoxy-L-arabinose transferase-like glycosyltransferase